MKTTTYLLVCVLFISCSNNIKGNSNITISNNQEIDINNYTQEEKKVINDFLKEIVTKDKYKAYKNNALVIMEEAESRIGSIYAFKYCNDCRDINIQKSLYLGCEFNESKIGILKSNYKEKPYKWKQSDFESKNISLLKTEELRKSIKLGNYTELPKRLLIYASVPLIYEEGKAYFNFRIGNSLFGFGVIEIVTVSMKKNKLGIWEIDAFLFDPNTTW